MQLNSLQSANLTLFWHITCTLGHSLATEELNYGTSSAIFRRADYPGRQYLKEVITFQRTMTKKVVTFFRKNRVICLPLVAAPGDIATLVAPLGGNQAQLTPTEFVSCKRTQNKLFVTTAFGDCRLPDDLEKFSGDFFVQTHISGNISNKDPISSFRIWAKLWKMSYLAMLENPLKVPKSASRRGWLPKFNKFFLVS